MAYFECIVGNGGGGVGGIPLTVNCNANFAGTTISVTDNTTTLTAQCPSSSPYTIEFELPNAGTWTASGVWEGQTFYSEPVTILPYETNLETIPDGKTATPTDDVQTWLHCANIWDKSYTTLNEVLADTTTLLALISSNNAVDYMARSKTWISSGLVPIMTSNTTPSGVAFTTTDSSDAWKLFDNDDSTEATKAAGAGNQAAGYEFTTPQKVFSFRYYRAIAANYTLTIQYSDDGTTYQDAYTETMSSATEVTRSWQTDYGAHKYWRIYLSGFSGTWSKYGNTLQFYDNPAITDNSIAMTYIGANDYCADTLLADSDWREGICNSEYFESVLNVKVPTMTSDTTPSGVASASTVYSTGYAAWKAFDGIKGATSNYWCSTQNHITNQYLRYKFTENVAVYKVVVSNYAQAFPKDCKIQYSNDDGSTFTDVKSFTNTNTAYADNEVVVDSVGKSDTWQLFVENVYVSATYVYVAETQFYGRATS